MKKKSPGARRRQACSLMSCALCALLVTGKAHHHTAPSSPSLLTPPGHESASVTQWDKVARTCKSCQDIKLLGKRLGQDASQAFILFLPYYECICITCQKGEARAKGETGDIFLHTGSLFSGEKHSQGQRRLREDSFLCEVGQTTKNKIAEHFAGLC